MISVWTEGLNEEGKKNFERQFHNASDVLERLASIYKKRLKTINFQEKDFDTPGWSYRAASNVGRREEIELLLNLINLDHRRAE
jgi:hypothetical protein